MIPSFLFGVAFTCQIVLISVHYPRRLRALEQGPGSVDAKDEKGGTEEDRDASLNTFALANKVIGAVGLALLAAERFPELGTQVLSTIVGTCIFFEIAGPLSTRFTLRRAGEITD